MRRVHGQISGYCDELIDDPAIEPRDYWSNTSSNKVVRRFIEKTDGGLTRSEIEMLVAGAMVTKEMLQRMFTDAAVGDRFLQHGIS